MLLNVTYEELHRWDQARVREELRQFKAQYETQFLQLQTLPEAFGEAVRNDWLAMVYLHLSEMIKSGDDKIVRMFQTNLLLDTQAQGRENQELLKALLAQFSDPQRVLSQIYPDLKLDINQMRQDMADFRTATEEGFDRLSTQFDERFQELGTQINTAKTEILEQVKAPQPATREPSPPVVGLASLPPVTAWEGRDKAVTDLSAVLLGSSPPQVMVVTGQGGIGKSSLALKLLEAIGVDTENHELTEACPFARLLCVRLEEGDSFEAFARTTLGHWGKEVQQEQPTPEQLLDALVQDLARSAICWCWITWKRCCSLPAMTKRGGVSLRIGASCWGHWRITIIGVWP